MREAVKCRAGMSAVTAQFGVAIVDGGRLHCSEHNGGGPRRNSVSDGALQMYHMVDIGVNEKVLIEPMIRACSECSWDAQHTGVSVTGELKRLPHWHMMNSLNGILWVDGTMALSMPQALTLSDMAITW